MNEPHDAPASTTVSVEVEAAPDRVWQALVTDEGFADWMGEGASIDARPDGSIVAPDIATGEPRRGTISTVDVEESITFDWWPQSDPSDRSRVTIDLEPVPCGSRVTVTETQATTRAATNVDWTWRSVLLLVSQTERSLTLA